MTGPLSATPTGESAGGPEKGEELVTRLTEFLSTPSPHVLLITGLPGAGKSSLLAALRRGIDGPSVVLGYRGFPIPGASGAIAPLTGSKISMVLVDPGSTEPWPSGEDAPPPPVTEPAADDAIPPALLAAVQRMAASGPGHIFVDSWDRTMERVFVGPRELGAPIEMEAAPRAFRKLLATLPIHAVICLPVDPDPELHSLADGVVKLDWEVQDGCRVRVATVPILRWEPLRESHFLFTLHDGRFSSPPRLKEGVPLLVGPSEPDPDLGESTQWPGSSEFARVFGRFRDHALTGIEMSADVPPRYMEVLAIPAAAHVLRSGGRVVWIPSPQSAATSVCSELQQIMPDGWIRERFRILSAAGAASMPGGLEGVAFQPPAATGRQEVASPPSSASLGPMLPEAYQFLQQAPEGKPVMFVLSFEGLRALGAVRAAVHRATVFPLIMGEYMRLPRFHGFGFGRRDDPLVQGAIPSVQTHIKLQYRAGRGILFGVRPETPGHMIVWRERTGRYSLLPMV